MAARTSSSIGVGITITLLGVACLALFILMIVFLAQSQAANRELADLTQETERFVRSGERQRDDVRRVLDLAGAQNMSAVGYLHDSWQHAMNRVTGNRADNRQAFDNKLDAVDGARTSNLLAVIRTRDSDLAALRRQYEESERDRVRALEDKANEARRVSDIEERHQRTIAAQNEKLDQYRTDVDSYREQVNDTRLFMEREVERVRDRAASAEASLNERIRELEREQMQLVDRLARLQAEKTQDLLKPTAEYALVDGEIIGLNPAAGTVTVDIGRRDKAILGMTFAVYSDATAIRPDAETGEYPAGKASIEITHVGETTSTARIIQETRGNPIVRGDVIANPIYDRNKVYTFLVYGGFDTDGDGHATAAEAAEIRAMIEAWGGRVVDELTGDVDFLVLGQRPVLPPRPGVGSPLPVVQEFMRLSAAAERYDDLWDQAVATSLPVLNENRLYTLIGRQVQRQ